MTAYLDASAVVPRFVFQKASASVDAFFRGQAEELAMTEFGAAEVSSAVARMFRMGQLDRDGVAEVLSDFDGFRANAIRFVDQTAADLIVAHAFVRRLELKLRTPDALHLAVARRIGATLVTLDRRLADAAAALGVAVLLPE